MNVRSVAILVAVACVVCAGCQRASSPGEAGGESGTASVHHDFGQPLSMTRAQYALFLEMKADLLGESEIARMSAIEMVYRNKTYLYSYESMHIDASGSTFAKMYRQFTGFEVLDIVQSDSILRPLTIEIRFDYDFLGTEAVPDTGSRDEDVNTAKADHDFRYVMDGNVVMEYDCDEKGDRIGLLPNALERPNYYDRVSAFRQARKSLELVDP